MADKTYTASSNPATDGFAVTPSDSTEFPRAVRAVYVGGAGDLVVRTLKGTTLTISAVPAGTLVDWIVVDQVRAATTATLLVAFF